MIKHTANIVALIGVVLIVVGVRVLAGDGWALLTAGVLLVAGAVLTVAGARTPSGGSG